MSLIRDYTDDEARAALVLKWGMVEPGVLPAWVAEMDYALAEPIMAALHEAVERGEVGYPPYVRAGGPIGEAYAGFALRHFGTGVPADRVLPTADVTVGVRIALEVLSERAPMVLPLPAYDPQHGLGQITGREQWDLPVDPDDDSYVVDLDALDRLFARGARTLLLTQPHNPGGHVHSRAELEGIRDVVTGTAPASSPTRSTARWCCRAPSMCRTCPSRAPPTTRSRLSRRPRRSTFPASSARRSSPATTRPATGWSTSRWPRTTRGAHWASSASVAAYDDGDPWLAALVERLDLQRTLLGELLAEHLPEARMRPLEATYMVWLDLRAYGHDDPAEVILGGGVRVSPGEIYWPGLAGHVRLNIATSPDRLTEIVRRMRSALTGYALT